MRDAEAMGEIIRGFVPFGEYLPDKRFLLNSGLVQADNVIPMYGNYASSPSWSGPFPGVGPATGIPHGLLCHLISSNSYVPVSEGASTRIWQIVDNSVVTDVSRGALYTTPVAPDGGWTGVSFGAHAILCPPSDPVQYQAGGVGNFADMITSTFAPRARFCFVLRHNLFLADLNLAAPYDTLSAGANRTTIAWSRNEDIRQFGSANVNPEIIGAGYQPLNFDLGDIRCAFAGSDYGIVGMSNGIVRVDGPPYTFRVISRDIGMSFPYGACSVRGDIYFVSPGGLSILAGGEGPARVVGLGKFTRSLIDNTTGFAQHPMNPTPAKQLQFSLYKDVSMAYDSTNDIIWVAYTQTGDTVPSRGLLAYNIAEDRASYFQIYHTGTPGGILFLRSGKQIRSGWIPGRDIQWVSSSDSGAASQHYLGRPEIVSDPAAVIYLQKGYSRPSPDRTSRYLRIRPVFGLSSLAGPSNWAVSILSTNKLHDPATTSGPFTATDTHGWIATPDTVFADYHAPFFSLVAADAHYISELEGFEFEAEVGGLYAA